MDIVDEVGNIYALFEDGFGIEQLLSIKERIHVVAEECKAKKIYVDSEKQRTELIEKIQEVPDSRERCIVAWNLLDDRLSCAPTSLHFEVTIYLVIPIIDMFLHQVE